MRLYLLEKKKYLNLSAICREIGITKQCLSMFMYGYDKAVTKEKLIQVINFIDEL